MNIFPIIKNVTIIVFVTSMGAMEVSFMGSNEEFKIDAPSRYRFDIIKDYLVEFADYLDDENNSNLKSGITSAYVSSKSIFENLVIILDNELVQNEIVFDKMNFAYKKILLSEDYKKDLKEEKKTFEESENIKEGYIKMAFERIASKEDLQNELKLQKDEKESPSDFSLRFFKYFIKNRPKFNFDFLNYKIHVIDMLKRLKNDEKTLRTIFLSDKEYVLSQIKTSNSDIHKIGGGVSILEFTKENEPHVRVVYKASSVLLDLAIIGNTKELNGYLKESFLSAKEFQSFAEIMNDGNDTAEFKVPTYKILPVESKIKPISQRIKEAYGYIEYIGHDTTEMDEVIESFTKKIHEMEKTNPELKMQDSKEEFQNEYNKILEEYLEKNNEFFDAKSEIDLYSHQFGNVLMIAGLMMSHDIHIENIRIYKNQIYLIDLENSFTVNTLSVTTCLKHPELGSFSPQSKSRKLLRIEGILGRPYYLGLDTYISSQAYEKSEKGFQRKQVEKLSAKKSISHFIQELLKKNKEVYDWMVSDIVKNVIFRDIPVVTKHWGELLFESVETIKNKNNEIEQEYSKQPHIVDFILRNKNVENRLVNGIIPAFYGTTKSKLLYFADGSELTTDNSHFMQEVSENKENTYFQKYPYDILFQHLKTYLESETKLSEFAQELLNDFFEKGKEIIII
jgi:hypothetical protein